MSLDYDDREPLAVWEAVLFPNWRWEAYEEFEENLYFGRVKSPSTYGRWEYGVFTLEQLKTAGAYRIDTSLDNKNELFPDGGYELTRVVETEFEAFQQSGDRLFGK